MKKQFLFILMAMLFSPLVMRAALNVDDTFTADGIEYKVTSTSPNEVQVGTGDYGSSAIDKTTTGALTIPASLTGSDGNNYSVTSISDYAFSQCSGLTSITIPNSVTSIGDGAFSSCSGLTSMIIEAGNTVYDSRNDCNAIISTETNELIAGCQNTVIPNSVTSIGEYAFEGCSGLTSVTIPNSVTKIGVHAFNGCSGLTSITIPNSVTEIGIYAFAHCSGLTSIVVENGNTVYDSRNNCNAIIQKWRNLLIVGCQNTVIPSSVKEIEEGAFYGCSSLTSITIPNSVTEIGNAAFLDCSGLTSITIPNSVSYIGYIAFKGCSGLTSVIIGATTPIAIDSDCFTNRANAILYVPEGSKSSYEAADYWKDFNKIEELFTGTLTDGQGVRYTANDDISCYVSGQEDCYDDFIVIPTIFKGRTVTSIGSHAFESCNSLTAVVIPRSVTSIGGGAFSGCSGLTDVTTCSTTPVVITEDVFTNRGNATLCVPQGCIDAYRAVDYWKDFNIVESFTGTVTDDQGVKYTANNDGTCRVSGHENSYNASIVIPKIFRGREVTSIGDHAFEDCRGLTSITIPNSVTSIEYGAFLDCYGLTSVTIPNSVTSIGEWAFAYCYCSDLTAVTIPSSVMYIGHCAFVGCSGLTSLIVEAGNTVYDSRNGCNAIIKTEMNELIAGCQNTVIPNSVTSIGDDAFEGCSGLTSITIPNSVTSIGSYAFAYCSGLTSITIPNSVTSIGWYAFYGCSGLTSITIPNSVTSIADNPFSNCSGLTSMIVEAGNTVYDSRNDCNAIIQTETNELIAGCQNTVIPNSVTSIGWYAFYGCSGLTSVTIPNSVTSIESYAFSDCSGLQSFISLNENPIAMNSDAFYTSATLYVPKGTKEKYQALSGWNKFSNIVELDNVTTTLQYDLVTFTSIMPLDFSMPIEGLKAYVISEVDGERAMLKEVKTTIPAGTGLILQGTAGQTYQIPYATTITPVTDNLLMGVTVDTEIGGNGEDYILNKSGKFVKANAGTLAAGKAYLKIPGNSTSRELTLVFEEATGVNAALTENANANNGKVFNLNGQQVSRPTRGGLYVIDGKKVFVK